MRGMRNDEFFLAGLLGFMFAAAFAFLYWAVYDAAMKLNKIHDSAEEIATRLCQIRDELHNCRKALEHLGSHIKPEK